MLLAVTLVFMGVVCYYFAPAAFINGDPKLFLAIINIILMLMILGLTLIINLLQPYLENICVRLMLLLFKKDRNLK